MKIALHKGSGFISKAIAWQTRSEYTHASVVLRNGQVIESREFEGVRHMSGIDPKENVVLFEVETTDAQADKIESFLRDQIGKPYDYGMVARFISRRQASRSESGKWFCSELAFAAFQQAGIDLLKRIEPWAVSPALLSQSPLLLEIK